jgi:ferredoxin
MATTHSVEILHEGETYRLQVAEDQKIIDAADQQTDLDLHLPRSCTAGVCTTCAARITNGGTVDQTDGMGVSPALQAEGYVLLCVAYPRSDLKLETKKEDEVYDRQFGLSQ